MPSDPYLECRDNQLYILPVYCLLLPRFFFDITAVAPQYEMRMRSDIDRYDEKSFRKCF